MLEPCERILTHHLYPFSSRLRSCIIATIDFLGYQKFEQVGVEEFYRLLNHLQACDEDLDRSFKWITLLLDIVKSSKEIQHLSHSYWEWLVDLAAYWSDELEVTTYSPHIMISLRDANEWDKLICWITIVWLVWPPEGGKTTEEDLKHVMFSLLHQQPGAIQKLEEQMEKWGNRWSWNNIPESFRQICKQAHSKITQQTIL